MTEKQPRRPGRPAGTSKSADKRDLLLDTALKMFAQQGIAETPLSAIAREAGVTSAMLHYYFNTREQLLDVLIDERFLPARASVGSLFEAHPNDPVAAITALAQRFIDISVKHSWFAPLWIREVLSESGLLKERMDARFGDNEKKAVHQCMLGWQKQGYLNPDIEPELVFLSLFGLTLLPIAAMQNQRIAGKTKLTAEDLSRHVASLLLRGIAPQNKE
ncbi:TetR/AcrR family transcriptional regulator [Pseudomonas reactans]|nr:TetR/AcrR family transcriptional regulator [Pseudomonas reactans]